ncbi:DUF3305 domain-containing protein [Rhodophyticola sp.]|jgi:hypothetical protein|uniref:DUF3305 domain-containing protein n=1 Tax=Rhodophyticola sp. TaxID=2680032 RepID=UPI003D2CA371
MPKVILRLGIVAMSRPPVTRWSGRVLRPVSAMIDLPPLEAGALMTDRDGVQTVYLGDHELALHSGETRHYIDNLTARQPSVWVAMDNDRIAVVTADPYEGEALASDPERMVEAVPMPTALAARLDAFIKEHHVEEVFHKRKRVPATSTDAPRAPRILQPEAKWVQTRGRSGRGPLGKG